MAISLQNLRYLLNKRAAQAKPDAGSQAMMMAAQAARPAGAPPLPKPVEAEEESAEGLDTEKILQEKDSEIEKAKKENESLRHELNKRELEYQREAMLREVEQKEKAGLDAITKERQNLQSDLTKYQAEEIKHKANMDKYTAEAEVKLEQQKSKAIIDYTKQQTNIQQKAVDEARRKADEIKQQAEKYREQQSRDAEQYRQQITGEIDKYRTQASQDIADEREALRTSATGTSPALQYMLDDALKALGSIPTPGANPIKMPKQATIAPTNTKLNIVETVSNKGNSYIKQARVVSQSYSNVLAKGITVPVPGFYPAVSNTSTFVDIITLNKQAGVKDDFLNQRLIPQLQAMLADPEFQTYIAEVAQTQNLQTPLPAKFTLGGLLDGVTAQDAMLMMSGDYEPVKNKAMKNAQNVIFTWINTPEGKKYIAENVQKLGSTPEELSAIGLPPQIFGGLLKGYTVGDLLQAAQEENYQWVVDGNNLASADGLHSVIEKAKKDYGINFRFNQDPTADRIPDLSLQQSMMLGLAGLFPQLAADEINGKLDGVIKNVIQRVNVPGLDKNLLLEQLADPNSHISDIIYGISDTTASQGADKKLGFQTALLNDNDQQLIVRLWPHITPRNRAILAGLLHPQYRNSVNWKRPAKPAVQPTTAKGKADPNRPQPGVDPAKQHPAPAPTGQTAPAPVNQPSAGQPVTQQNPQQDQPSDATQDNAYIVKSKTPLINPPGLLSIGMVRGDNGELYYGYKQQMGDSAKGKILAPGPGSPIAAKQPTLTAPEQGKNTPTDQPGGSNATGANPGSPKPELPKPEVPNPEGSTVVNSVAGQGSLTPKHSRVPYGKWDQTTGGSYSSLAAVLSMLGVQVPQYIPDNGGRFKRKLKADKLQKEIGLYYKDSRLANYNPNYMLAQQTSPGGATLLGQFNQV